MPLNTYLPTYYRTCRDCQISIPARHIKGGFERMEDENGAYYLARELCPCCFYRAKAYDWRRLAERSYLIPLVLWLILAICATVDSDPIALIAHTWKFFFGVMTLGCTGSILAANYCEKKAKRYAVR